MSVNKEEISQFRIIVWIVFLGFIGISIPYLIFPALFLNPNYSILAADFSETSRALLLGITLAAYPFGQFIGSPILGSLSDIYGRKKVLVWTLWITAGCYLLTGFAIKGQLLGLLVASRFVAGLMEGNIAIARAMASEFTSLSKHKTFGRINAAASIAYLIGPFLGGIMSDKNVNEALNVSTPFYFICFLFLSLATLSSLILKSSFSAPCERQSFWAQLNLYKRLAQLFTNQRLQVLMIACTAFTLAVDIFYEFGPVYLTLKWGLGPVELIYYNAVLCLGLAIGNGWLSHFLSSRVSSRAAIIAGMGGFAVLQLGVVGIDSSYLMMILFGLSGLLIGLAVTLITVKISDSVSNQIQGEVMGVQVSLRVFGDAIICLFGGALLLISSKIILIAAALLSLAAMGYYFCLSNRHFRT